VAPLEKIPQGDRKTQMAERGEAILASNPGLEQAPDEQLVLRVQQGEKQLFACLVQRHERSVYRIVFGILQNHADSEEILQESFLKALQHIGNFRGEAQFRTWLIQIAINEARMRRRKYRPNQYESLDEEPEDPSQFRPRQLADWRPNPEETLAKQEMAQLLERAMRSLPKIYREVFVLRDIEHLSNEEAASALGISVPASKTRLLRARLMMREYLAPHFKVRWRDQLLERLRQRGRST